MGIAQVGREKIPFLCTPRVPPACPVLYLVCLTEPADGIRSDRQSGTSGIVKLLFCAQAMREAKGPCPRNLLTWRARVVSAQRYDMADGEERICTFLKWRCVGGNFSTRRVARDIFGRMSKDGTVGSFLKGGFVQGVCFGPSHESIIPPILARKF